MTSDDLLFDEHGNVDVEGIIECRDKRNIPPNPPPRAVSGSRLDGKALASIAVSFLIDSGSWKIAAVMLFYIDSANRTNGLCFPSEATTAGALRIHERTVRRANRFWLRHGYPVDDLVLPLLSIAVHGRVKANGTKESNAYNIGWLPLIALVQDRHYNRRTRRAAAAILRHHTQTEKRESA